MPRPRRGSSVDGPPRDRDVRRVSAQEQIYNVAAPDRNVSKGGKLGISLTSGTIAGVAAAIISHPADTLLSKMNKSGAGGDGGMFTRMARITSEMGLYNLCTRGRAEISRLGETTISVVATTTEYPCCGRAAAATSAEDLHGITRRPRSGRRYARSRGALHYGS